MSKWKDEFCAQYSTTGAVKRLNQEIKEATNKKKVEDMLSDVARGKYR